MKLELEVRGRMHHRTGFFPVSRDVYLREIQHDDAACRVPFLMHTDCSYSRTVEIIKWCKDQNVSVVYNPPECENPEWVWPDAEDQKPPVPVVTKPDSALDF